MTDFPFHYKGTVTLSDGTQYVDLHNVELWEEQDVEEVSADGVTMHLPGLRSWHGVATVESPPARLLVLLGGEANVRLADGRLGAAFVTGYADDSAWVTGYADDSAWVVEISGIGPTPNLNTI